MANDLQFCLPSHRTLPDALHREAAGKQFCPKGSTRRPVPFFSPCCFTSSERVTTGGLSPFSSTQERLAWRLEMQRGTQGVFLEPGCDGIEARGCERSERESWAGNLLLIVWPTCTSRGFSGVAGSRRSETTDGAFLFNLSRTRMLLGGVLSCSLTPSEAFPFGTGVQRTTERKAIR